MVEGKRLGGWDLAWHALRSGGLTRSMPSFPSWLQLWGRGAAVACLTLTRDSSTAFSIGCIRAMWAGQWLALSVQLPPDVSVIYAA